MGILPRWQLFLFSRAMLAMLSLRQGGRHRHVEGDSEVESTGARMAKLESCFGPTWGPREGGQGPRWVRDGSEMGHGSDALDELLR